MTYGELVKEHSGDFRKLRNRLKNEQFNFEKQRLEASVVQKLVQAAAKAAGQDEEKFVQAQVGEPEVTDAEVKEFHSSDPRIKSQPLDQIAPRIKAYLGQQKKQKALVDLFERVKKENDVNFTLPRVELEKVKFDLAGRPAKGKADAKVTIVEFSDFECPYCSRAVSGVEKLVESYPDDVRVVFMHFPLGMHPRALPAAIASQCANQQGKFWSYHDKLFENQAQLTDEKFEAHAKEAGLDVEKFKACVGDPKTEAFVKKDMAQGTEAGVEGTPSFFINGEPYSGGVPTPDAIKTYVEG